MGGRGSDSNTSDQYWERQAGRISGQGLEDNASGGAGASAEELQQLVEDASKTTAVQINEEHIIRLNTIETLANWQGNAAEMPPHVIQDAIRQLMARDAGLRPLDLPSSLLQQLTNQGQLGAAPLLLPSGLEGITDQTPLNPATGTEFGIVSPSDTLTDARTGGDVISGDNHLMQDVIPPSDASSEVIQNAETSALVGDTLHDQISSATSVTAEMLQEFRNSQTIMKISDAKAYASQMLGPNASAAEIRDLTNQLLQPLPVTQDTPNITFVDYNTARAGASYPFLDALDRRWRIIGIKTGTSPEEIQNTVAANDRFNMDKATFFYVKDGRVEYLFIDGMNTEEFLKASGLELHQESKGDYVLSKRFSRITRPYYATKWFEGIGTGENQLDIHRFRPGEMGQDVDKVWDGAAVIDREILYKLMIPENVSAAKHAQLTREIRHAHRVEFTIMTNNGQEKGHAIVGDNLAHDIMLREDIKGEVRLTSDKAWLGVNFVHHHDHVRLDVQSMINMGHTDQNKAFITEDMVMQRIEEEGELLQKAVETGEIATVMGRIDRNTSEAKLDSWPMRKAFALGGHPMWFPSWVRGTFNQGIEGLKSAEDKDRFPFHGGRFYLMCDEVARLAGHNIHVKPGEVYLSEDHSTAYVSRDDWVQLHDTNSENPHGIRDILGGADQDDAAICIPFTDKNTGQWLIHIRRNPNQDDEYINMRPAEGSSELPWHTVNGSVIYPEMNKDNLPSRKDFVKVFATDEDPATAQLSSTYQKSIKYLSLVDADPNNVPGKGIPGWTREGMQAAIARAELNEGAVGVHCNGLMVYKAVFNEMPPISPDSTENVVDGMQKTGADCSRIKEYWRKLNTTYVTRNIPIPRYLQDRLGLPKNGPRPPIAENHWYDRLHERMQEHSRKMEQIRDDLANQAMPPARLLDKAFEESTEMSRTPGKTYWEVSESIGLHYRNTLERAAVDRINAGRRGQSLITLKKEKSGILRASQNVAYEDTDYQTAANEAYQELAKYHPDDHTAIARVFILKNAIRETKEDRKSDRMIWTNGPQNPDGSFQPGWSDVSFRAMQETGSLNAYVIDGKHGLYVYPGAIERQPNLETAGVKNMWYNLFKLDQQRKGKPIPDMQDLRDMKVAAPNKKGLITAAEYHKQQFSQWVRQGALKNREVHIKRITENNNPLPATKYVGRYGLFTPEGHFLGMRTEEDRVEEGRFRIGVGFVTRGGEDFRFTLEPIKDTTPAVDETLDSIK